MSRGIMLVDCMARVDGERKTAAANVLDIDESCGQYCYYTGESCENRGIDVFHNGVLLTEDDEVACNGRCFETAGFSSEYIDTLRRDGTVA